VTAQGVFCSQKKTIKQMKKTQTIIDREAGFLIKYTLIIRREDARDAAG